MKIFIKESVISLPSYLKNKVKTLLGGYGLQRYYGFFINNIELLPLIANLMNWSAKTISYSYYDYKEALIRYLIKDYPRTWADEEEGVVYFETPYGQVSFHVSDQTLKYAKKMGINNEGRSWDESYTQEKSLELVKMAIDDVEKHYVSKRGKAPIA